MKEIWNEIPDYQGYEISNLGKVRSYWRRTTLVSTPRILTMSYSGYQKRPAISLKRSDGKIVREYLHRHLLFSFVGPCPDGMECCHNDGDIFNNDLSNLRWDYHRNNELDKYRHGTSIDGARNPMAKLTEKDAIEIRQMYANDFSPKQIAEKFNVHRGCITRILVGQRWAKTSGPIIPLFDSYKKYIPRGDNHITHLHPERFRGERVWTARLKESQVLEIREKAKNGQSIKSLSEEYKVGACNISHIIKRISWKHI